MIFMAFLWQLWNRMLLWHSHSMFDFFTVHSGLQVIHGPLLTRLYLKGYDLVIMQSLDQEDTEAGRSAPPNWTANDLRALRLENSKWVGCMKLSALVKLTKLELGDKVTAEAVQALTALTHLGHLQDMRLGILDRAQEIDAANCLAHLTR